MNDVVHASPNHWQTNGEEDPHGTLYDTIKRKDLTFGCLTDDELAFRIVMDFRNIDAMCIVTAVKDRLRWLSRKLYKSESENARLKKLLEKHGVEY